MTEENLKYIRLEYYNDLYGTITDQTILLKKLYEAEKQLDILTYNRIRNFNLSYEDFETTNLISNYEREVIKDTICELADFIFLNKEMLDTSISAYSLNGVSVQFEIDFKTTIQNGIVLKASTYNKLLRTRFVNASVLWR